MCNICARQLLTFDKSLDWSISQPMYCNVSTFSLSTSSAIEGPFDWSNFSSCQQVSTDNRRTVTGNIFSHLLSLLNGYKASELGHNGVLLTDIDDVRLAVSFDDLQHVYNM